MALSVIAHRANPADNRSKCSGGWKITGLALDDLVDREYSFENLQIRWRYDAISHFFTGGRLGPSACSSHFSTPGRKNTSRRAQASIRVQRLV
jgi:hypothetical protein